MKIVFLVAWSMVAAGAQAAVANGAHVGSFTCGSNLLNRSPGWSTPVTLIREGDTVKWSRSGTVSRNGIPTQWREAATGRWVSGRAQLEGQGSYEGKDGWTLRGSISLAGSTVGGRLDQYASNGQLSRECTASIPVTLSEPAKPSPASQPAQATQPRRESAETNRAPERTPATPQAAANTSRVAESKPTPPPLDAPRSIAGLQLECRTPRGTVQKREYTPAGFYIEESGPGGTRFFSGGYSSSQTHAQKSDGSQTKGLNVSYNPVFELIDGAYPSRHDDKRVGDAFDMIESISWTQTGLVLDWSRKGVGSCVVTQDPALAQRARNHLAQRNAAQATAAAKHNIAAAEREKQLKPARDAAKSEMIRTRSRAFALYKKASLAGGPRCAQIANIAERMLDKADEELVRLESQMERIGSQLSPRHYEYLAGKYVSVATQYRLDECQ